MPLAVDFFLHYAYAIVFLWILAEQLGMPVPSLPILLTAGSLTVSNRLSFPLLLASAVAGCFLSDTMWYFLGRRFGGPVVRLLCRLSLEASTCVRKTEERFAKHGAQALLAAKFIPGLGTVAAPIAGQSRMPYLNFLAYDLGGALLWSSTTILTGRFFGDVIERNPHALRWIAHSAGALFVLAILGLLVYRFAKQRKFLRQMKTTRMEPQELKRMLDAGQQIFIVDLRHPLDYLPDPRVLPGALRILPDQLMSRSKEIPRDRDIVLYCTCPSDATAAKTALRLRREGIYRVRLLGGGFDRWKKLGFPLVDYTEEPLGALAP